MDKPLYSVGQSISFYFHGNLIHGVVLSIRHNSYTYIYHVEWFDEKLKVKQRRHFVEGEIQ